MKLHKQFINNFVFPTWACAASFYNENNNLIVQSRYIFKVKSFDSDLVTQTESKSLINFFY